MMTKALINQSGSMIVNAMVLTLIMSSATVLMFGDNFEISKLTRLPRVKAEMIHAENQIRELVYSPTTYTNCDLSSGVSVTSSGCKPIESVIRSAERIITGAKCVDIKKTECGLRVEDIQLTDDLKFKAALVYEGYDVPMQKQEFEIKVPPEVLQSSKYTCPNDRPLFQGFAANGQLLCSPLPNPKACDLDGKYIGSISASSLSVTCVDMPAKITCPDDQIISQLTWVGSTNLQNACTPRLDPYIYFQYTPNVNLGPAPSIPPPNPDPVEPASYRVFDRFVPN